MLKQKNPLGDGARCARAFRRRSFCDLPPTDWNFRHCFIRSNALWRSLRGKEKERARCFSRRSIRYSLSVLVTSKRPSNFLLYTRAEQFFSRGQQPNVCPSSGLVSVSQPNVCQSSGLVSVSSGIRRETWSDITSDIRTNTPMPQTDDLQEGPLDGSLLLLLYYSQA